MHYRPKVSSMTLEGKPYGRALASILLLGEYLNPRTIKSATIHGPRQRNETPWIGTATPTYNTMKSKSSMRMHPGYSMNVILATSLVGVASELPLL